MKECFFCSCQQQKNKTIWENDSLFARYSDYPVSPGHALIVPKRHVVNLEELTRSEWSEIKLGIEAVKAISEGEDFRKIYAEIIDLNISPESIWYCQTALDNLHLNTQPAAFNYGVNDGTAAGRTIDHFHWHIIPRFEEDVPDPRGGICDVIPGMGNYKVTRK